MEAMLSPTLLVLAAGMGSRYGGLKQIDPIGSGGETIIDYSIYDAIRAGFGKVVFVIRKDIEQTFRKSVGVRFEHRVAVEYVFQDLDALPEEFTAPVGRTKPWGTTHAILAAASAIDETFAVINADDFYGSEGYVVLQRHLQSTEEDYAMVGFVLSNTLSEYGAVSRGVCRIDGNGFLQEVVELTGIERDRAAIRNVDALGNVTILTGRETVSMNMWGFTPKIFGQLADYFHRFLEQYSSDLKAESYLPSAVNQFVQQGSAQVKVLNTSDSWCGVTYREDHRRVVESIRRLVSAGIYPEKLWV